MIRVVLDTNVYVSALPTGSIPPKSGSTLVSFGRK
jgi:predicted nucleic acid-binding protein